MKVRDLIALLQKLPLDSEVYIPDPEVDYETMPVTDMVVNNGYVRLTSKTVDPDIYIECVEEKI